MWPSAPGKMTNRSHTHTDREQHPRQRHTHTHTTRTTPQTNTSHKHLTTLEGAATTVRATSNARVGGRAEVSVRGRVQVRRGLGLGLYKILFYFEAFVHESIILLLPTPTCIARTIAMLLHVYCAIYEAPPTHLLYAMHTTILVMAISCKGQPPGAR